VTAFASLDSDGDGLISLQEFQAVYERIFNAMDTDKDGSLTLEEIQDFMATFCVVSETRTTVMRSHNGLRPILPLARPGR
jgi:Ca2+-binding EF-hand superfamily protein